MVKTQSHTCVERLIYRNNNIGGEGDSTVGGGGVAGAPLSPLALLDLPLRVFTCFRLPW